MPSHWHKNSIFGDGPRSTLDRNARARFRFLLRTHRQANRLTADGMEVGEVMVAALGNDGRLDLAHATIADRALCHVATVKRSLNRLRDLGLIAWTRRLRRDRGTGWRCEQTSNAYCLRTPACEAQAARAVVVRTTIRARDQDEHARQSAAQQLLVLGFKVPAGWNVAKIALE